MKRVLCLLLCLMLVPLSAFGENVEDSLIVGMISTRTTEIRPLTPQERDIVSLYGVVYESLVTVDDNGLPQPLLAESWTESGGGQTWTFTLRENITFSDGTPLTAQDVVASGQYILNLAKNDQGLDRGFYGNIRYMVSSFTAQDDRTVVVKAALWGMPGALMGLVVSLPVARFVRESVFQGILLVMIAFAGSVCIIRAVEALF